MERHKSFSVETNAGTMYLRQYGANVSRDENGPGYSSEEAWIKSELPEEWKAWWDKPHPTKDIWESTLNIE